MKILLMALVVAGMVGTVITTQAQAQRDGEVSMIMVEPDDRLIEAGQGAGESRDGRCRCEVDDTCC